jgi:hypothetical protein
LVCVMPLVKPQASLDGDSRFFQLSSESQFLVGIYFPSGFSRATESKPGVHPARL